MNIPRVGPKGSARASLAPMWGGQIRTTLIGSLTMFQPGSRVTQYDYVQRCEQLGTIVSIEMVWDRAMDGHVQSVVVDWDCGVTTRHPGDDFTGIAGRAEFLVGGGA